MAHHPTYREHTYFLDEADDDNSRMATKCNPLRHASAIDEFARELTKKEVNDRMDAIESFVFMASGRHEMSSSYQSQELTKDWQGFKAPPGMVLLAKSGCYAAQKSWHVTEDGSQLTLIDNFGMSDMRTVGLTKAQAAELLQTLANPCLYGNAASTPNAYISSHYFKVDQEVVQTLAYRLGIDLAPKSCVENGWMTVERGVLAEETGYQPRYPGDRYDLLQASVSTVFQGGLSDNLTLSRSSMPKPGEVGLKAITDIGGGSGALVKRILKNEMEPFITHFRRVDEGKQAIAVEQSEDGRVWNATLFSEVLGTLVVKSASFSDRHLLILQMQKQADVVLQPAKEVAREAKPKAKGKERNICAGR